MFIRANGNAVYSTVVFVNIFLDSRTGTLGCYGIVQTVTQQYAINVGVWYGVPVHCNAGGCDRGF